MTHATDERYKNINCRECKRKYSEEIYFIRWKTRDYTCEDCIEVAYHNIKADKANERRKK